MERTNNERNFDIWDIVRKLSKKEEIGGEYIVQGTSRINPESAQRKPYHKSRRLLFLRVINRFIYCFLFLFFSFPSSVCVVVVSDLSLSFSLSVTAASALFLLLIHINLCCCCYCCCLLACSRSPADYRRVLLGCCCLMLMRGGCWISSLRVSVCVLWHCSLFSWYAHI